MNSFSGMFVIYRENTAALDGLVPIENYDSFLYELCDLCGETFSTHKLAAPDFWGILCLYPDSMIMVDKVTVC